MNSKGWLYIPFLEASAEGQVELILSAGDNSIVKSLLEATLEASILEVPTNFKNLVSSTREICKVKISFKGAS